MIAIDREHDSICVETFPVLWLGVRGWVIVHEARKQRKFEELWRRLMRFFKPSGPGPLPETMEDFKALMETAFYQGFECGVKFERDSQKGNTCGNNF